MADLGQVFTKGNVARYMVSLFDLPKKAAIMDPCFGAGSFLDALIEYEYENVTACEMDTILFENTKDPKRILEQLSFVNGEAIIPEKTLIIFDIYENCAYDIQNELKSNSPDINIETLIGSVRDYYRMESIFKEYKPDVVYHAAAHKHVPLMEDSPNEAIKNNCLGTLNIAKLADKYEVDNFVLISTDKAVRPTNVMGASKRICEMIIQAYAHKSIHTKFAAVRFGNVLGSNGSVIPLFLKQIENGGPVTVTHKEITRFFMTIPEAVSLVLQAGLFADGGEIFVLDMGEPVKIYDLAKNLIEMKGYVPNKDIMIKIVGLRPGEKLYEELLMDEEGLRKTDNQLIFIGHPIEFDDNEFFHDLEKLIKQANKNECNIKEYVAKVCNTYTITNN